MLNRMNVRVAAAVLAAGSVMAGTALARQDAPLKANKPAVGQDQSQQWVLLVGTDKDNKLSKLTPINVVETATETVRKGKSGAVQTHPNSHELTFASYGK